jgi:anti-sigma B factor antagonist
MEEPEGRTFSEHPVAGIDRSDDAIVIHLTGELDLYNAALVRAALLDAVTEGPTRLVIDLEQVEFVDSTALGVLIEARTKLTNHSAFLLASPQAETHRALAVSGLDRHLRVHESVAAALAAPIA